MQRIARLRELSGAKALLALKCFSTWSVFPLMCQYMDGSTSSSLHEVKLGFQKFGGETHAYSVAFAAHEIDEVLANSDKVIFNSLGQLARFGTAAHATHKPVGLRVNPGTSNSPYLLADPARPHSRLGEADPDKIAAVIDQLSGFMFHNNCENRSFESFDHMLGQIEARFGHLLQSEGIAWVSLGGGIHFCDEGYPLEQLAARLRAFADQYQVQVYLEPGEASITNSATLEVSVLDINVNGKQLAIVDSSTEAHMLDLLIYNLPARIEPNTGEHAYLVCGKTCLAGDIFGEFRFEAPLQVGDRISIQDAAGYTMVKKNWFNGVGMPSIVVARLDGTEELVQSFGFDDYVNSLS
ncbi:carboxynorspermidine decarboxylase [Lampropedia puyangensis]|uniref:Carboxynorspermidine/carboxyspermidine decarboxylase n=1 Tax=Lampropedia puyangensis TaxID=1330072 RepID=A0A4S8EP89_9BURK|nr:carboxynorspermidine decarboxylase [Lampropedia puyangensis]THT96477.1 carboxynorspermidine decarboxylase [Lampropedia puyangensis]